MDTYLEIVGPLTSIQSVIRQVEYIPPAVGSLEAEAHIRITDKNGLKAWGRTYIWVNDPE
jgi:hypothetical protein